VFCRYPKYDIDPEVLIRWSYIGDLQAFCEYQTHLQFRETMPLCQNYTLIKAMDCSICEFEIIQYNIFLVESISGTYHSMLKELMYEREHTTMVLVTYYNTILNIAWRSIVVTDAHLTAQLFFRLAISSGQHIIKMVRLWWHVN